MYKEWKKMLSSLAVGKRLKSRQSFRCLTFSFYERVIDAQIEPSSTYIYHDISHSKLTIKCILYMLLPVFASIIGKF